MTTVATVPPVVGTAARPTVAITAATHRRPPGTVATTEDGSRRSSLRWVVDREDDHRCMQDLLALSDPATGVVTVLAAPQAPWPVLARGLLLALGKDRAALTGLGPRRLVELAGLWVRAEPVRHLVVLGVHRLPTATLGALEDLAHHSLATVWAVVHGPVGVPEPAWAWPDAAAQLYEAREPSAATDPTEVYGRARDLARRAGRTWLLYRDRTMKKQRPIREGTELAELLQPLTIDAHDVDDLRLRLHATIAGLRDEGLHLETRDLDPRRLQALGPRFGPDTVTRLRRIASPVSAGALTLALATDQDAPNLAGTRTHWTDPAGRHLRTVTGTFRIPPQARPMIRALLEHHRTRRDPADALLVADDGTAMLGRRIANVVRAGTKLSGLPAVPADRRCEKRYLSEPFAFSFTIHSQLQPLRPADI